MLSIKNLTKIYKSKRGNKVTALKNVSLNFGESGLFFILGKSGSGKSTLLNLIGGLHKPSKGEIFINARSSKSFKEKDFDSYRNTYIGFVFQEYNLIENYTVGTNIALALELQGKNVDKTEIEKLLVKFELVDGTGETFYERHINELSGGQKQRVAIARALIKNPKIILADEPTGSLDSEASIHFYELLKELSKDKLIIVVSHDQENAERFGDRIIELEDGVIISDIIKNNNISQKSSDNKDSNNHGFIKSKLPLKRSFIMGASALLHKKFRLISSLLLSIITLIIFGFSITMGISDKYDVELRAMYEHNQAMITIGFMYGPSDEQKDEIAKYNNYQNVIEVIHNEICVFKFAGPHEYIWDNKYNSMTFGTISYLAKLDSENGETDANLRPDGRFINKSLCKLPKQNDEIAITDSRADMFMKYGYREEDDTVTTITTPDDLVGKVIDGLKITGVYSTELDKNVYREYDGIFTNDDSYIDNLFNGNNSLVISYGFVSQNYFSDVPSSNSRYLLKLTGDFTKDKAFFDKLRSMMDGEMHRPILFTQYSNFVSEAFSDRENTLMVVSIFAGVFSVFSALLIINYLLTSISVKKKEVGILRALGARRIDAIIIFMSESMLIAATEFIISLVGVIIISVILNGFYYIPMFVVGIVPILLLFLLSFGIAALSTLLSVGRIAFKEPIAIINK